MDPSFLLNNPNLKQIDPEKLRFLTDMATQPKGKSPQEIASFLMAASSGAKKDKKQFDRQETDLIVSVLKQNMSESDKKKADMILGMMKNR